MQAKVAVLALSAGLCMGASQCLPIWAVFIEYPPGEVNVDLTEGPIGLQLEPVVETIRTGCSTPLAEWQVRQYSTFFLNGPVAGQTAEGDPPTKSLVPFVSGNVMWPWQASWSDVTMVPFTTLGGIKKWLYQWATGWFLAIYSGCAGDPATSCYPTWVQITHNALALDTFDIGWAMTDGHTCTMQWSGILVTDYMTCGRTDITGKFCRTPLDASPR